MFNFSHLLRFLYYELSLLPRDLWVFLKVVVFKWNVLMSGLIMTAVYLFERLSGHEVPPWFYWSLTVFLVAVAFFLAWRDERRKWERLDSLTPLNLTLRQLVAEYRDRTTVHADRLTKDRIGKLYRASWPIKDIAKSQVSLQTPLDHPGVLLYFSRKSRPTLEALQKGEHITVEGRILRLSEDQVTLTGCDLMEINAPKTKQEGDPSR